MTVSNTTIPAFLWSAAFLCSLFLVNAWQLEWFGGSVLLTLSWSVLMLERKIRDGWKIPKSTFLVLVGLFWLNAFLSVIRSDMPFVTFMGLSFFSVMPLTLFTFAFSPDERQMRHIGQFAAAVFAALAVWAIIQFLFLHDYFGGQARHPLANPNSLAALFSLALFPTLGWMLTAPDRKQSAAALILCTLLTGGIIATGSRGAPLAMIPALAIFAWSGRNTLKGKRTLLLSLALGVITAIVMPLLLNPEKATTILRFLGTLLQLQPDISNNRLHIWTGTWALIKDHWLLGTGGIGTFFLHYPAYRIPEEITGTFFAHNDPLQYWAETGLAGIILFYAILIAAIIRTTRALAACPAENEKQRMLILAPFCALTAMTIHTHLTFNLYNLSILLTSGFLLAVWFAATHKVLRDGENLQALPEKLPVPARAAMVALPFLFCGYLFAACIVSEHFTKRARTHALAGELEDFATDLNIAHQAGFHSNYRTYLLAVNVPLTILRESKDTLTRKQKEELYAQSAEYLHRARTANPRTASAAYYLGYLQTLVPADVIPEGTPAPEEYYREALALDPLHLGARLALAEIHEERGDLKGAMDIVKEGLPYIYRSPMATDLYGQALLLATQTGDKDMQKRAVAKMLSFKSRMDQDYARQSRTMTQHLFGSNEETSLP